MNIDTKLTFSGTRIPLVSVRNGQRDFSVRKMNTSESIIFNALSYIFSVDRNAAEARFVLQVSSHLRSRPTHFDGLARNFIINQLYMAGTRQYLTLKLRI